MNFLKNINLTFSKSEDLENKILSYEVRKISPLETFNDTPISLLNSDRSAG